MAKPMRANTVPPQVNQNRRRRTLQLREHPEGGYILVAVIFMVALVLLSLAIAAPRIASAIQRDRELELVHRGEQYKHAIRLYYKKFNAYPTSIDQLESSNNIRFLRKRYIDPLTGKDDWKLIHMGEAHVRPLGFFGQALGMSAPIAGASNIGTPIGGSGTSGTGNSPFSNSGSIGGGSVGGSGGGFGSSSGFGGGSGGLGGGGMLNGNGGTPGGGGLYASSGGDDGSGTSSGSGSSSGSPSGTGASSSTSTSSSSSSQTLGGGPVVGVVPPQTKTTILTYRLKTHYNEWEFVYDPIEERMAAGSIVGGAGGNITGVNGTGAPGTGTPTGNSNPFGTTPSSGNNSTTGQGSGSQQSAPPQ